MVLHGSNFWKWVLGPVVLFVGERLYVAIKMVLNQTTVESGMVHGNVSRLQSLLLLFKL